MNCFLISINLILMALTNAIPHQLLTDSLEVLQDMNESGREPGIDSQSSEVLRSTIYREGGGVQSYSAHNSPLLSLPKLPLPQLFNAKPLLQETAILNAGKKLSEAITAKIVGPVVLFNSKVAAAAGALPPILAAKGAVIGAVIATPIEIGAIAGSKIVSGLTGKLVAIPISVASGAAAKLVGAVQNGKDIFATNANKGQQIWDNKLANGRQIFKNGALKLGHLILKPVAVVVGAHKALAGIGLGLAGSGMKTVGLGMQAVGTKMTVTGLKAKGLGNTIIKSQLAPIVLKSILL